MESDDSLAPVLALLRAGLLDEAAAASQNLAATDRAKHALAEGLIAQRRGDLARALSCTGRAVQLDIDDADALVALATIQLELGHPSFALIPAERASRLAPDRAEPYAVLAAAQQRLGRAEAALQAIRRAAVAAGMARGQVCATPDYRTIQADLAARLAKIQAGEKPAETKAGEKPAETKAPPV
jgi:tetratricopeptide (TPR) repeat protein